VGFYICRKLLVGVPAVTIDLLECIFDMSV